MSLNNRHIANQSFWPMNFGMFSIGRDFGKQETEGFQGGRCKIGLEDILQLK